MALAILIISSFLFYSTSKYFDAFGSKRTGKYRNWVIIIASVFSLLSIWLFASSYNLVTSIVIWSIAFMTVLSALIITVKLNKKWIYAWGSIVVLSIIIDLT